jgi:hypothetical protein
MAATAEDGSISGALVTGGLGLGFGAGQNQGMKHQLLLEGAGSWADAAKAIDINTMATESCFRTVKSLCWFDVAEAYQAMPPLGNGFWYKNL